MPSYFPSKKVLAVGVLAIGLLAWSIVYQNTSQQNSAITNNPLRTVAQAESVFPDTDSDGLYDWEETLYGTDLNIPDSDGDGVMDGEQYVSKPESIMVRLSDSVYSAISRLGQEAENAVNPVDQLSKTPKIYDPPFSESNLILRGDTKDDHSSYILQTLVSLSPHSEILNDDPLILVQSWLTTKSPTTLDRIKELSEMTMEIARSLISIPVPPHYKEAHLSLTNNLYLSGLSLMEIELSTKDPMAGFFAAANYTNYLSKYLKTTDEVFGLGYQINEE